MITKQYLIGLPFVLMIILITSNFLQAQSSNSGPIAHYSGDNTTNDISGNGFNGIVHNQVSYTADRFNETNNAYNVYGGNSYFKNNELSYAIGGTIGSIAFWIKPNSTTNHQAVIGTNGGLEIQIRKKGEMKVPGSLYTSQKISPGIWTHVAIVQTGYGFNCYFNGSKLSESNTTIAWFEKDASKVIYIGKSQNYDFAGSLDDIRFYNRALSDQEVLQLANVDNTCTEVITIQNPLINSVDCANPTGSFSVNGGVYENGVPGLDSYNFTFFDDNDVVIQSKSTNSTITGLPVGNYKMIVENATGCSSDSILFEIEKNLSTLSIESVNVTPKVGGSYGKIEVESIIVDNDTLNGSSEMSNIRFELWDESMTTKLDDFVGNQISNISIEGYYNVIAIDPNNSCTSAPQITYIHVTSLLGIAPSFEQALYEMGYDEVIDGRIYKYVADTITKLDVSNRQITSLSGIKRFTSLVELNCRSNLLETIDLYGLSYLEKLDVSYNQLDLLEVRGSDNPVLKQLIATNNVLTKIKIFNQLNDLIDINFSNNLLNQIDLQRVPNLNALSIANNKFLTFDLSSYTALNSLDISGNELVSLDISSLLNLTVLDAKNNENLECVLVYPDQELNIINAHESINNESRFYSTCPIMPIADGSWSDPSIWPGGLIPGGNEHIKIKGMNVIVTSNVYCQSLELREDSSGQPSLLQISDNGHLSVSEVVRVMEGKVNATERSKVVLTENGRVTVTGH